MKVEETFILNTHQHRFLLLSVIFRPGRHITCWQIYV